MGLATIDPHSQKEHTDSPLILSITQIPLNKHNSKQNFKTKGGLAKHNARRQYKANIMI